MVFAVATVLFATQVYTVSPAAVVSWPQNRTESSLECTRVSSLNNWYVCTTGLPTAEQVTLIMFPLQMFSFLLSTVNSSFSGLTKEENKIIHASKFQLKAVIFYGYLQLLFCANFWHVLVTTFVLKDHQIVENPSLNCYKTFSWKPRDEFNLRSIF